MSDTATEMDAAGEQGARRGGRRAAGGAAARRAARSGGKTGPAMPYITRRVPVYEVLGEEVREAARGSSSLPMFSRILPRLGP